MRVNRVKTCWCQSHLETWLTTVFQLVVVGAFTHVAARTSEGARLVGLEMATLFGIPFIETGAALGTLEHLFEIPSKGLSSVFRLPEL